MTNDEYMQGALRTLSDRFHPEAVTDFTGTLVAYLDTAVDDGVAFDNLKRAVFYGKDVDPDDIWAGFDEPLASIDHLDPRLIHGVVGLVGEAGELAEVLNDSLFEGSLDTTRMAEEIGDIYWHLAVILHFLGLTEDQVKAMNQAKLRARFPHKFEQDQALQRDEASEQAALLGAST